MSFLVVGQNYWGHGDTLADAKKNWRNLNGGSRKLSDGYEIFEFGDDVVFKGVDQMGYIHWFSEHGQEPTRKEVPPRKRAKR